MASQPLVFRNIAKPMKGFMRHGAGGCKTVVMSRLGASAAWLILRPARLFRQLVRVRPGGAMVRVDGR
ncbi:hypothetical protein CSW58_12600 [Caulobacter sp. B11]|nr:hypothetical protein CSW58_12600 [Caulobacter sp. B11]